MPVILEPDHFKIWLSPEPQPEQVLKDCLKPYPCENMEAYEISKQVNSPMNDTSDIIQPMGTV